MKFKTAMRSVLAFYCGLPVAAQFDQHQTDHGTMIDVANLYRRYLHFQLVNAADNVPSFRQPNAVVQDSFDLSPATPVRPSWPDPGNDQITLRATSSHLLRVTP